MRPLTNLIHAYEAARITGDSDVAITGITSDSRNVGAGHVFVAVKGVHLNGEDYIAGAVEKGAVAIVVADASNVQIPAGVVILRVADTRIAYAKYAAVFYGKQPAYIAAITGTDGKTSTAEFLRQLWELTGHKAASIGTLGVRCDHTDNLPDFPNTTPDAGVLAEILAALAEAGVEHVAVEASSHGLDQYRLDGMHVSSAAFTTFGRDHGDYHGTVEAYFDAKKRLFDDLLAPKGLAILNGDMESVAALKTELTSKDFNVVTFGGAENDIAILEQKPTEKGLEVALSFSGQNWQGVVPLYGEFQIKNVLVATSMAMDSGASFDDVTAAFAKLKGVSGRVDLVGTHPEGMPIFTDYAHTASALEKVLQALRPHTENKLHVVCGCGGDRDKEKRPVMGKAAADYADVVIITDDNPRSEDPATIRAEVMAGCPGATEIGDRTAAIDHAIRGLQKGDVLVIAGKGHESEQIIGDTVLHHHDGEVAQKVLATLNGKAA